MIHHYPFYVWKECRDSNIRMPQSIFLETSESDDYLFALKCVESVSNKEGRSVRNKYSPASDDFIFATLVYFYTISHNVQ